MDAMIPKALLWLIYHAINPAILWCYGWKYESIWGNGMKFECWVDPMDGLRYSQSKAIEKCESRIK